MVATTDNSTFEDIDILSSPTYTTSSSGESDYGSLLTPEGITKPIFKAVNEFPDVDVLLRSIVEGLSILNKQYEDFIANKDDFRRVSFRAKWLLDHLTGAAEEDDVVELHRRIHLKSQLDAILEKLEPILALYHTGSLTNATPAQMILSLVEDIRDAIIDYQTSLQHAIDDKDYGHIYNDGSNVLSQLRHADGTDFPFLNGPRCLRGTRIQVLEYIENWAEDRNNKRVYWLNGVAGSGKTTIARTFASRVFAGGRLGACFFCSRDFTDRSNLHFIFPTLAFQLAHRFREFRAHLVMTIKSNPNIAHESLTLQLENLIIEPLRRTGLQTIIIIDALDECKDDQPASAILSLLARYVDQVPLVKFFITGRPEPRIRSGFRLPLLRPHTDVYVLHDVDSATVNHDIELFLRTRLLELILKWEDLGVVDLHRFIDALVRKSDGLFIYADTMLKFIAADDVGLKDRLELILSMPDNSSKEGSSGLDSLYNQIVYGSYINIGSEAFSDRSRPILGTILLAFSPHSCATLGVLLDIPTADILGSLRSLHSLLLVPHSSSQPIRAFHKSFPDYLTDSSRCKDSRFYVDASAHHAKIAIRCLELMQKKLKKNICDLPQYVMNEDVGDLFARREECIGDALEYACQFWATHLHLASEVDDEHMAQIIGLLWYLFENRILAWFEVLSVMGDLRSGIRSLHNLKGWLVSCAVPAPRPARKTRRTLLDMISDAETFLLYFFDPIQASASHIYHSALPWSSASSLIRKLYCDQALTDTRVYGGGIPSWNACLLTIRVGEPVHSIAVSIGGDYIAASTGETVKIFEVATRLCCGTLGGRGPVAFSPEGVLLASGSEDNDVLIWDLQTGSLARTFIGHTNRIRSVAFSPSGTMLASGSYDGTVRIWNMLSGSSESILDYGVQVVGWSRDQMRVITVGWSIKVWDVTKQTCLNTIHGLGGEYKCVAYSQSSSRIASVDSSGGMIYDAFTGKILNSLPNEEKYQLNHVRSICFSPNGDQIMYASGVSVYVWDWMRSITKPTPARHTAIIPVTSSPGDDVVSVPDNDFSEVWQAEKPGHKFGETKGSVYSICFAEDGRLVASTGLDFVGTPILKIWDATTALCIRSWYSDIRSVAFSPDSSLVCGAESTGLNVWNINTSDFIRRIDIPRTGSDKIPWIRSICFSPNGNKIAVLDKTLIALFDVSTGHRLAILRHDDKIYRSPIRFSSDGSTIITNSPIGSGVNRLKIRPRPRFLSHLLPALVALRDDGHDMSHNVLPSFKPSKDKDWILNKGGMKVCWIPPDCRCGIPSFHHQKFAMAHGIESITIVDFSNL